MLDDHGLDCSLAALRATAFQEASIQAYRQERLRAQMRRADIAALVIYDPISIRYACGSRNMQVWTMHNFCRYLFLAADGPCVLFDIPSSMHLSRDLKTVDELRPAWAWDYMMVGDRAEELATRWAREIVDLLRETCGASGRLALDRGDTLAVEALKAEGVVPLDGKGLIERARAIKSREELAALVFSFDTCSASILELRAAVQPGMTESEALSILVAAGIKRGGEYPETRLMTSGPRTNPWFQETADRVIEAGDFLAFDTDMIGPMGFYTDISRSWVIGRDKPSDEQRRIYDISRQQIERNVSLLRSGVNFWDYGAEAFKLPAEFEKNRYADVAHGVGLAVEYPFLLYPEDADFGGYDGHFEENMVVCVESYIGAEDGREGVKLEQPVWITKDGPVVLSDVPLEDDYA